MSETKSRVTPYAPDAARVMVTDYGPHPPEVWAQVTAEHLIRVDNLTGHRRAKGLILQGKVADVLEPHHGNVQSKEKEKLASVADHHLKAVVAEDAQSHAEAAYEDIVKVAADSDRADYFTKPEVKEVVIRELTVHFNSAQHIERSWHRDSLKGAA